MREPALLVLVDDEPTFVLKDGSIIPKEHIGYLAKSYGLHGNDRYYERLTKEDIYFIVDNEIECEIEMTDEFSDPDLYTTEGLYDGERKPKLHKGKIIIHYV